MNQNLVETKEVRTALPVRLIYLVLRLQPFERALKTPQSLWRQSNPRQSQRQAIHH
jgi:hypothetical protein